MGCTADCVCNDGVPSKSLFSSIDIDKVTTINEKDKDSCKELLKRSESIRNVKMSAHSKSNKGLVIKIPFICKVLLNRIEIMTTFTKIEVFINNQYVTLTYKPKVPEEYFLPGGDHIFPITIPAYKHKSVDTLTIRLSNNDEYGSIGYLCICGVVTGKLPKAINVSYELYGLPENTKSFSKETTSTETHKN
ncbi:hypothetical protein NEPAR06_2166 [Nematocida parisii]|uniref:PITH domain-containing protein n=1 Tax=Nematocida parisii (strain ERTm3) TaxID=935791 RepID=I3EJP4_NEMP3|nr:uncharacterized protein NEPG_01033 [Nematocida parisii ERTm1]EIJ89441.1 hypothetical protein NEQG_00211 [Nematocida parisii ERTm3]KAI5145217.1 hypothetical protein NEPAR07_1543 [Nematocida parisii]EIJ94365.1 hypothetical protein NEPG_01033 [Nematocida parisii ERTm1]KAI5145289.1 hypothetical protein NEPAR04_2398 [Nematocida parisii]KAI5156359.1 hypothetical protein NEPAR06_2166 [Nematocida parisii]|eukprot:XP_013058861.1 hypothetical protein NEPG_01033 [Nematocida parisii ERTm1]